MNDTTCDDVSARLSEYADGDLHEAAEIDTHLPACDGCSAELAAYRRVIAMVGAIAEDGVAPSPVFADEVVMRLDAPRVRIPAAVNRVAHDPAARTAWAASIGGALVGAGLAALVMRRRRRREPESLPA